MLLQNKLSQIGSFLEENYLDEHIVNWTYVTITFKNRTHMSQPIGISKAVISTRKATWQVTVILKSAKGLSCLRTISSIVNMWALYQSEKHAPHPVILLLLDITPRKGVTLNTFWQPQDSMPWYNSPHRLPNGKCYFTKALPSLNYNGVHDDDDDDDELISWK